MADDIKPFKLHVADDKLDQLAQKLKHARLPHEPAGYARNDDPTNYHRGVPLAKMRKLVTYWRDTYLPQWRAKHEKKLNELPMYTTPITVDPIDGDVGMDTEEADGFGTLDIHFVHQRSGKANAVPLLFIHGWPGCFIEAVGLMKELKVKEEEDGVAFDVVVPNLPNFGFSSEVDKAGFHLKHYAQVCHKLMLKLGYSEYTIQGGDWGSIISRLQARMYPEHVKAVHVNFVATDLNTVLRAPTALIRWIWNWPSPARDIDTLKRIKAYLLDGSGYFWIQMSRPQTMTYALDDSPVALLGWIYDKLIDWTDDYAFTEDQVLEWISIYWFSTAGPGASVRIYHETVRNIKTIGSLWGWIPQPLGITQFPKDLIGLPSFLLPTMGRIAFEDFASSGGHFAAYERPEKLAGDLNVMFGRGGGAFGVVAGKEGVRAVNQNGEEKKKA